MYSPHPNIKAVAENGQTYKIEVQTSFTDYNMDRALDRWLYYLKHEGSEEKNITITLKTLFKDNPRLAELHEKYLPLPRLKGFAGPANPV